jgi:hypothetical protein
MLKYVLKSVNSLLDLKSKAKLFRYTPWRLFGGEEV